MALLLTPILLSGCQTIQIPDFEVYGSLGEQGAVGMYFLDDRQEMLNPNQWAAKWDDLNHPMVAISAQTLADFKEIIEKFCTNDNDCVWMTPQQQTQFAKMNLFLMKASTFSPPSK